jgi:hypothetical protein
MCSATDLWDVELLAYVLQLICGMSSYCMCSATDLWDVELLACVMQLNSGVSSYWNVFCN